MDHKREFDAIELRHQAVEMAKDSDVAVLFMGVSEEFEGEALDRHDLALPVDQEALILVTSYSLALTLSRRC